MPRADENLHAGNTRTESAPDFFFACFALTSSSVLVELLRAYRWDFWMPLTREQWAAAGGAAVSYAVVLFVASKLLAAALKAIRRISSANRFLELSCAGLATVGLWCILFFYWDGFRASAIAFTGALVGGVWFLCALTAFAPSSTRHWTRAALVLGLVSAVFVLDSTGHYYVLDLAARRTRLPEALAAWCAVVFVAVPFFRFVHWRDSRSKARRWACAVILAVLAIPLASPLWVRATNVSEDEAPGPNLLFIVPDALRAKSLALYGGPVSTPVMERIALQGVRMDRAYALAPWTIPSMLGLFASNYPPELTPHGTGNEPYTVMSRFVQSKNAPTLAELADRKGYITGAAVGNAFLDQTGMLRGFDHKGIFPVAEGAERWGALSVLPFTQEVLARLFSIGGQPHPVDNCRVVNAYAEEFLKRYIHRPHLLYAHYMAPHDPYDPPHRFRTREGPWEFVAPSRADLEGPKVDDNWNLDLSADEQAYTRSLYEGLARYVDESIGRLLDRYAAAGELDNTIVCIVSDHGEEFWEHGRSYHGQGLYDELLRVPVLLMGPGIKHSTIEGPVSHIDLIPTIADLAGFEPNPGWLGSSYADALRGGPETAPRPCFSRGTYNTAPEVMRSVVSGRYKLIHMMLSDVCELYDLANDPDEHHDLAFELPDVVKGLKTLLDNWIAAHPYVPDEGSSAIEDTQEMLRSMGYLH